jgi:hypothetical protein
MSLEERRAIVARRDPEKVREQTRRKMAKRRREGTPEQLLRIEARAKVRLALSSGKLTREACEVCGTNGGHAHHDDYSEPLNVRWLCRRHHDELHREAVAA